MFKRSILSGFLLVAFVGALHAANVAPEKDETPKPPIPSIKALKTEPSQLTLKDARDARKILVWGEVDGRRIDLTTDAQLKADSDLVEIDADKFVTAKSKGKTSVTITAAGKKVVVPVVVESGEIPPVRFVRDVQPMLSKAGCNAGTCHGAAKGKNGFKLSLRGYDPEYDYETLVNDLAGRRFNRVAVEQSLMLLKPTGEVPHEGRQVFKADSRQYKLLYQWIDEGTKHEPVAGARPARIEVIPAQVEIDLPGRLQHLIVMAHYPDNTTRDVTREAILSSSNIEVLEMKEGYMKALRRGEAAVLVKYDGLFAVQQVTIMGDRSGFTWNNPTENNYIDKFVHAKLKKSKLLPSELCTDSDYIRRVTLDLTGQVPTPERVKTFLTDKSPSKEKREKLVDELMASKDYTEYWANKWADLLQCNSENLGQRGVWLYREYIRNSIAQNKPYDTFVRELLSAEGSSFQNPAVNYFRVLREPGKIAEDVSQTFLGTRFNCNKCHDHPFEKWTQNQYYEFGAYFARVAIKKGSLPEEEVVYRSYSGGEVKHPKTDIAVPPKVPFGEAKAVSESDRRASFVDWLTSRENPLFAKSMANRVWSYFHGRGIIDPVDDIRAGNPPSNPELLEALTTEFVKNNFDLRKLMRDICTSRTYQLSIVKNKWNEDDNVNFSHASPRRLSAEQLMDAVAIATGYRPKFNGMPAGMRAVEVPDGFVAGNDFLALFGRPKRQSACECERSSNLTLSHAMNLINGGMIGEAVHANSNRIQKIVDAEKEDVRVVEELYYAILNRPPSEKEMKAIDFKGGGTRLEVAQDLAWALLNSPAFLFNR